jgi:hypothetical protein
MYQILSPDNLPIDTNLYTSIKAAKRGFNKWVKQYKRQGYYSSNSGRIELIDLEYFCTLVQL